MHEFIDVCYGNPDDYKGMALRLGIEFMCADKRFVDYSGGRFSKKGYVLVYNFRNRLDQTIVKEIAANKNVLGFPFWKLVESKGYDRATLALRLCMKYKAKMHFASFAHNPFEMRQPSVYFSLVRILVKRNPEIFSL